jgi:very-short-patch-repair endonuclease
MLYSIISGSIKFHRWEKILDNDLDFQDAVNKLIIEVNKSNKERNDNEHK